MIPFPSQVNISSVFVSIQTMARSSTFPKTLFVQSKVSAFLADTLQACLWVQKFKRLPIFIIFSHPFVFNWYGQNHCSCCLGLAPPWLEMFSQILISWTHVSLTVIFSAQLFINSGKKKPFRLKNSFAMTPLNCTVQSSCRQVMFWPGLCCFLCGLPSSA